MSCFHSICRSQRLFTKAFLIQYDGHIRRLLMSVPGTSNVEVLRFYAPALRSESAM